MMPARQNFALGNFPVLTGGAPARTSHAAYRDIVTAPKVRDSYGGNRTRVASARPFLPVNGDACRATDQCAAGRRLAAQRFRPLARNCSTEKWATPDCAGRVAGLNAWP